ncbi:hypothetical protein OCS_04377 [Ophiocordyceps sinensis CO18]|uniref:Uncharacterized protein n=1 Tax=Ophiocordyceps sinensis (strain Co18 / CGMCC 3.14243) TaxID=911162 RepID=T5ADK1_OPHSC|nr:hypothetical protein OCS_04377 [Ophiocordyceps sinensis CO18]
MLSWSFRPDSWSFDVSSLIVLIGEREELSYRLSQRSLLACLSAAPVIGLQSYIRSYDLLLETGPKSYFTPYGCNTAPLRNMRLQSAMDVGKLLADGRYTVYAIPPAPSDPPARRRRRYPVYTILLSLWVALTWLVVGLMTAVFLAGSHATTWVGFVNCLVLSAWSVVLRVLEHFLIRPAPRTATSNRCGERARCVRGPLFLISEERSFGEVPLAGWRECPK